MATTAQLYAQHLETLQQRTAQVLQRDGLEALVIHSGHPLRKFLDDQDYPFQCNPHFKHWLPLTAHPHCWLVVNGTDKPKLIYYLPQDYWHQAPSMPEGFWCEHFDIAVMSNPQDIEPHLPKQRVRCAYIGEHPELAEALAIGERNPESVLNYLHYYRAYKTAYELECIEEANSRAVRGHIAAKETFYEGASEFEIHLRYLACLGSGEQLQPYNNIVALNRHAAVLHYDAMSATKHAEQERHSLLIDAGAEYAGYASDITRSYAYRRGLFAELICEMDKLQQALIRDIRVDQRYTDLHLKCHHQLAKLLVDFELISCSASSAVEQGISRVFFPHGLGHHLGLQVHDMGGFMLDDSGATQAPPELHPYLRCTRKIEVGQVLTIEPGLYFIDLLLEKFAKTEAAAAVNWELVDELRRFGGIRIEDNVAVTEQGCINLTREANWT